MFKLSDSGNITHTFISFYYCIRPKHRRKTTYRRQSKNLCIFKVTAATLPFFLYCFRRVLRHLVKVPFRKLVISQVVVIIYHTPHPHQPPNHNNFKGTVQRDWCGWKWCHSTDIYGERLLAKPTILIQTSNGKSSIVEERLYSFFFAF